MKRGWFAFLTFVALAGLGALGSDKDDMKGTWRPESAEMAGAKFPEAVLKVMSLTLLDDTYKVAIGEQVDEGTVSLDPAKSPKAMDIKGVKGPNAGKTFPCIYELKDETLRICHNLGGKDRPSEFKTKQDSKLFLVTCKRPKL